MDALLSILEEESEILDFHNPEEAKIQTAIDRARTKIRKDGSKATLTQTEKAAVKYALEDVGDLYLNTGTSAGFNNDLSPSDIQQHRTLGRNALRDAAALGISPSH